MWVTPPFGHMALPILGEQGFLQIGINTDTKTTYHKYPCTARLFLLFSIFSRDFS